MVPAKKDLHNLLALSVLFLIVLFLTSCHTSPLYPDYFGADSAIFALIGKGMTEGKTLYADLFDHKGPMIFFINMFGMRLAGRTGIFVMQWLFGSVSLVLLYFTGKMLLPDGAFRSVPECLQIFISGYGLFFYTFERGNLTEEYSLLFLAVSLFFLVRYARHADQNAAHHPGYAFVYGICLAFLAFMRLNNAVTLCAGILAVAGHLVCRKEFKNLLVNLLWGCVGLASVSIPVLWYFLRHNTLQEMLYATFLHNFRILQHSARTPLVHASFYILILYLPMLICGILLLCKLAKKRTLSFPDVLLGTVLVFNILMLLTANRYPHYFTIFVPVYILFLCRYLHFAKSGWNPRLIALCTLATLMLVAYRSGGSFYRVHIEKSSGIRHAAMQESFGRIPEQERHQVIGYNIAASDYLSGNIIPCYRYYTLQNVWSHTNPEIRTAFMDWVSSETPLWVLVSAGEGNPALAQILEENYDYQFENDDITFFRRKEPIP